MKEKMSLVFQLWQEKSYPLNFLHRKRYYKRFNCTIMNLINSNFNFLEFKYS